MRVHINIPNNSTGFELTQASKIIEELGNLVPVKNKHTVIEARALHVITSAVNLIESIRSNYGDAVSEELVKRLVKSIVTQDPGKFKRKLAQVKRQDPS